MPHKSLGVEQIVTKLRQVEALQSQGKSVAATVAPRVRTH
jgi:hypothetical protein